MFIKNSSNICNATVGVVGSTLYKKRNAMWAIAFKSNLIVTICICSRSFLYSSLNIVFRHVLATCVLNSVTQRRVCFWISVIVIFLYSNSNIFDKTGEDLAASFILCTFSVLYV